MIWGESQLSELAFFVYTPNQMGWRARVKWILFFNPLIKKTRRDVSITPRSILSLITS